MDNSRRYAEFLTRALRHVASQQPSLQSLQIRSVCDVEAGQFLIIGTGWEQTIWQNLILFHAWLKDGKVVVVENNFESIVEDLITAGIAATDIVSVEDLEEMDRSVA